MNAPDLIIHVCEGAVIAAGLLLAKICISAVIEHIQEKRQNNLWGGAPNLMRDQDCVLHSDSK
jgi:hypothetical protein